MNRTAIVLFVISSTAPAAPVPKEAKVPEKVQGTWKVESLIAFGQPVQLTDQHWTLDATGALNYHAGPTPPDGAEKYAFLEFDIREKTVDFRYNGSTFDYPGLVELRGDTLKICIAMKDDPARPKAIEAGPSVSFWTLKRVKEKK